MKLLRRGNRVTLIQQTDDPVPGGPWRVAAIDSNRVWLTRRREGRVEDRLANLGEVMLYDDSRDVGRHVVLKFNGLRGEIIGRYAADRFERWWILWQSASGPMTTTQTEDDLVFTDFAGRL